MDANERGTGGGRGHDRRGQRAGGGRDGERRGARPSGRDGGRRGGPSRSGTGGPSRGGAERGGTEQRGARHTGPSVPEGAQGKPVGADRARKRPDAPPRRPRGAPQETRPPRPDLPVDDEPILPKAIRREIDRTLGPGRRAREVALALSVGSQAIDEGYVDVALPTLAWAKDQAPRVPAIREAYGVARYLAEDFAGALTELQAYARMTGRTDHHPVIADCLRATGRDLERVEATIRQALDDPQASEVVRVEATIVLAGAMADAGQLDEARRAVEEVLAERRGADEEHHLRARSLAADLAQQAQDVAVARRHLEVLLASEAAEALEVRSRLAALPDD